jgi:membrane-associated phospholipid phosphatase
MPAPVWLAASVLFFAYVIAVAVFMPRLPPPRRLLAAGGAGLGLAVCAVACLWPYRTWTHELLLPPLLLLAAYWTSGLLFTTPMPRVERAFGAIDSRLGIDALAASAPRWTAELLEVAYAGVYPVVPIALAIHELLTPAPDAARFWTVILVTDFICFGVLPWIRTRPPRAFLAAPPWQSRVRALNLRLLGTASSQVNTFPSGHAAEAAAAALLVAAAPWPFVASMSLAAALICAGAVLGRYHYAVDAVAGLAVAIVVAALA